MNLSKLVVAAVSIAAFALVWVPGRGSSNGADGFGARTHRALAHATVPNAPAGAEVTPGRVESFMPDSVDAWHTSVAPVATSMAPIPAPSGRRARSADRARAS